MYKAGEMELDLSRAITGKHIESGGTERPDRESKLIWIDLVSGKYTSPPDVTANPGPAGQ